MGAGVSRGGDRDGDTARGDSARRQFERHRVRRTHRAAPRREEPRGLDRTDDDIRRVARARAHVGESRRLHSEEGLAELWTRARSRPRPVRLASLAQGKSSPRRAHRSRALRRGTGWRHAEPACGRRRPSQRSSAARKFCRARVCVSPAARPVWRSLDDSLAGRVPQHAQAAVAVAFTTGLCGTWAVLLPVP